MNTKINTDFSLQRIGWLLRKDWIEHKKSIAYASGTFLIVLLPFLWLNTKITGISESKQAGIYLLGSLGCFLYYCQFVGRKVHFAKGLYLTLPASTAEKYVALLLEAVFLFDLSGGRPHRPVGDLFGEIRKQPSVFCSVPGIPLLSEL